MIYSVPDNLPLRDLKQWLAKNQPAKTEPAEELKRAYLDTFDWRLFRAGSALEVTARHGGYLLTWRKLGSGEPIVQTSMRKIPRFANEFVAPGIRQQLHETLGERSLLPQVSVASSTRSLSLMDDEEKTLVRIELRQDRVVVPHSTRYYRLPDYVYLFRYRGYEDVFRKKCRALTEPGRLQAIDEDPLITALDYLGVQPSDYNNKPFFQLDPEQPTHSAIKQILDAFRRIMETNIEGLCNDQDPEFLHDYLLALRRTRCLVNRYLNSFPVNGLDLIKQDFEWVEKIATPVRDLDIYLCLFDDFGARVDKDHRTALGPLHRFLKEQKHKQQRQMRVPLQSPRYRRLMDRWQQFLQQDRFKDEYPPEARQPIAQTAGERIWEAYREILENGYTITADSPIDDLLALHQRCKWLAYQMEIFRFLYPEDKFKPLMEAQQCLQQNLNRLHDLHLQSNALLDYRNKMRQERRTMPISLEAIDLLTEDMAGECHKVRRSYTKQFKQLAKKKAQKNYRALFGNGNLEYGTPA